MRRFLFLLGLLFISLGIVSAESNPTQSTLNRGISVAHPTEDIVSLGYGWMKVYDPPAIRYSSNVLYRLDVDAYDYYYDSANTLGRLRGIILNYGHNIDAYEIGNEPNIIEEWKEPPAAYQYAHVLCEAYQVVKEYDPSALVISAGIAPTGRIEGTFDGHFKHNGIAQDEREYLTEFIISGGHHCADAIGFHPMGFRADFDATPDITTNNPNTDCTNGFCFRTIEKFYDVLVERGLGYKQIWATEVGWLLEPPQACLSHPSWAGREWQIVSAEKQASNIIGAFDYAEANYPWLQNLIVFNYNFDDVPWYETCEQMRYYSTDLQTRDHFIIHLPLIRR